MSATPTKADINDLLTYLRAIAANTENMGDQLERIADALEAANAADPLQMIEKALADAPKPEPQNHLPPDQQWRLR